MAEIFPKNAETDYRRLLISVSEANKGRISSYLRNYYARSYWLSEDREKQVFRNNEEIPMGFTLYEADKAGVRVNPSKIMEVALKIKPSEVESTLKLLEAIADKAKRGLTPKERSMARKIDLLRDVHDGVLAHEVAHIVTDDGLLMATNAAREVKKHEIEALYDQNKNRLKNSEPLPTDLRDQIKNIIKKEVFSLTGVQSFNENEEKQFDTYFSLSFPEKIALGNLRQLGSLHNIMIDIYIENALPAILPAQRTDDLGKTQGENVRARYRKALMTTREVVTTRKDYLQYEEEAKKLKALSGLKVGKASLEFMLFKIIGPYVDARYEIPKGFDLKEAVKAFGYNEEFSKPTKVKLKHNSNIQNPTFYDAIDELRAINQKNKDVSDRLFQKNLPAYTYVERLDQGMGAGYFTEIFMDFVESFGEELAKYNKMVEKFTSEYAEKLKKARELLKEAANAETDQGRAKELNDLADGKPNLKSATDMIADAQDIKSRSDSKTTKKKIDEACDILEELKYELNNAGPGMSGQAPVENMLPPDADNRDPNQQQPQQNQQQSGSNGQQQQQQQQSQNESGSQDQDQGQDSKDMQQQQSSSGNSGNDVAMKDNAPADNSASEQNGKSSSSMDQDSGNSDSKSQDQGKDQKDKGSQSNEQGQGQNSQSDSQGKNSQDQGKDGQGKSSASKEQDGQDGQESPSNDGKNGSQNDNARKDQGQDQKGVGNDKSKDEDGNGIGENGDSQDMSNGQSQDNGNNSRSGGKTLGQMLAEAQKKATADNSKTGAQAAKDTLKGHEVPGVGEALEDLANKGEFDDLSDEINQSVEKAAEKIRENANTPNVSATDLKNMLTLDEDIGDNYKVDDKTKDVSYQKGLVGKSAVLPGSVVTSKEFCEKYMSPVLDKAVQEIIATLDAQKGDARNFDVSNGFYGTDSAAINALLSGDIKTNAQKEYKTFLLNVNFVMDNSGSTGNSFSFTHNGRTQSVTYFDFQRGLIAYVSEALALRGVGLNVWTFDSSGRCVKAFSETFCENRLLLPEEAARERGAILNKLHKVLADMNNNTGTYQAPLLAQAIKNNVLDYLAYSMDPDSLKDQRIKELYDENGQKAPSNAYILTTDDHIYGQTPSLKKMFAKVLNVPGTNNFTAVHITNHTNDTAKQLFEGLPILNDQKKSEYGQVIGQAKHFGTTSPEDGAIKAATAIANSLLKTVMNDIYGLTMENQTAENNPGLAQSNVGWGR